MFNRFFWPGTAQVIISQWQMNEFLPLAVGRLNRSIHFTIPATFNPTPRATLDRVKNEKFSAAFLFIFGATCKPNSEAVLWSRIESTSCCFEILPTYLPTHVRTYVPTYLRTYFSISCHISDHSCQEASTGQTGLWQTGCNVGRHLLDFNAVYVDFFNDTGKVPPQNQFTTAWDRLRTILLLLLLYWTILLLLLLLYWTILLLLLLYWTILLLSSSLPLLYVVKLSILFIDFLRRNSMHVSFMIRTRQEEACFAKFAKPPGKK